MHERRNAQALGLGLRFRAGVADFFRDVGIFFREVFLEHGGDLVGHDIVGFLIGPRIARVEDLVGDARAGLGHVDVEAAVVLVGDRIEAAVQGCRNHGAGVLEVHAAADAVGAAGPAGVDQEDLRMIRFDSFAQHAGVDFRSQGHEGFAEQGGEGRHRLGNALFRAGYFRRKAGDEVVHSRFLAEAGDRRQDAEAVGRQEDDDLRDAADAGNGRVGNIVDRIADAGIFRILAVEIVRPPRRRVEDDVFNEAARTDGVVNVRFLFGVQVDAFGIAAAFEVEDASRRPAVFVVADELAVRVCRQGRFPRAGQAEEDGRFLRDRVHVGRAVHGQDAFVRQEVVHDGEDALFDFTGVLRAGDEDDPRFVVDDDRRFGTDAVRLRVAAVARRDDDRKVRVAELAQFVGRRADEQVADKQVFAG